MKFAKILTALLIFALAIQYNAAAEKYSFRVLAKKGSIEIQTEKANKWAPVKTGQKIFKSDKIKLGKKAYIGLVHNSRKTIELKKEGTYTINDLNKQIAGKKSNISGKFASFLMDEVSSGDLVGLGDYKNKMGTTGATERALKFGADSALFLTSPEKQNLIVKQASFSWLKFPGNSNKYKFTMTDRFDKPVYQKEIRDTVILIDAAKLNLKNDSYYFWNVTLLDRPDIKSRDACFLVLSEKQAEAIRDTVKILREEVGGDESATAKIILAAFYEQNLMIAEAKNAYKDAIAIAPEIDTYKKIYHNFLLRTNISD